MSLSTSANSVLARSVFLSCFVTMENIEECTKAKSVLNTLGPIANQVVELKRRHGIECEASTVLQLLHQCTALKTACQHLAECLLSFAQHHSHHQLATHSVELQKELEDAVEAIMDATRDLHKGDVSVCSTEEVWVSLVECTENLLSILVSALLAWDNANIQQVESQIDNLIKVMENLAEVRIVQGIPDAFQEVVDAAFTLFSALERRYADLYQKQQKETVQLLSLQLHHTLPLLAVMTSACVQRPVSKVLKSSREMVTSRIRDVLKDLKEHIGQGSPYYDVEEPGIFVKHVDKVLELLVEAGTDQNSSCVNEKVRAPLEEVLRHAIAVAYSSCDQDKEVIMAMCENVLKQLHAVATMERGNSPDAVDLHVSCDILMDCLELLEQRVNAALIRLIVQTMADPLAPINTLVEALHPEGTNIPVDRKALQIKIEEFDQHIDNLFLVGGFAIACTTDTKRVRQIRDVMLTLEWLETCLISAVVTVHDGIILSKGELCQQDDWIHAQMLIKHWKTAISHIKECFDQLLDPPAFIQVSKEEMHRTWAEVKGSLYTQDMVWLGHRVHYARAVARHLLDLHKATPYLSGMQVDDIELAIREIKSRYDSLMEAPEDHGRFGSLLKRLQFALTIVSRLSSSLNEDNSAMDDMVEQCLSQKHVSGHVQQTPYCRLSDTDKKMLVTSNIEDIPVDVDTPVPVKQEPLSRPPLPSTLPRGAFLHNQHFPSLPKRTKSLTRLGEIRGRGGSAASSVIAGEPHPAIATAENTAGTDISIDISKFLSCSTNAFQYTSTRTSRRNFSLKVREIQVNLGELVKEPKEDQGVVQHLNESKSDRKEEEQEAQSITRKEEKFITEEQESQAREPKVEMQPDSPKLSSCTSFSSSTTLPSLISSSFLASCYIQASHPSTLSSLKDVSALIAQDWSVNDKVSTRSCPEEELSEILENLTSLAENFSSLASFNEGEESRSETVIEAGSRSQETGKRSSEANSAEEGQVASKTRRVSWVNHNKVSCTPLKGIRINNASFSPEFPPIKTGDTTQEVFHDVSTCKEEGIFTHEPSGPSRFSSNNETSVWQDFTAILEAVTPAKSKLFNFTDNFSEVFEGWFSRLTTPFQNQEKSKERSTSPVVPRMTHTSFKDINYASSNSSSPSTSKLLSESASESSVRDNSFTSSLTSTLPSNISISSASVGVRTPQRIHDLHMVKQRLAVLKSSQE